MKDKQDMNTTENLSIFFKTALFLVKKKKEKTLKILQLKLLSRLIMTHFVTEVNKLILQMLLNVKMLPRAAY